MGLFENIAQGLANAAGSDAGPRIEQRKADRKATQHEELQANTRMTLEEVERLHGEKAKLHPGTDDQQIQAIDKRLGELQQNFTDLYHPEKNPGALEHLGGIIKAHLGGKKPPPATPAEAKAKFSFSGSPALGLSGSGEPDKMAAVSDAYQKTFGAPLPKEKQEAFFNHLYGGTPLEPKETPTKYQPQLTTTTDADGKQHYWRVPLEQGGNPEEVDFKGEKVEPKKAGTAGSKFSQEAGVYEKAWGKKIADWTPEELSYFNQKQAFDSARSGQSTTTRLEKDVNGNIVPVEITNTHGPTRPPVDPHAAPMTPGAAKKRAAGAAGKSSSPASRSNVRVGDALPFKGSTPAITKAKIDYDEAAKLSSVADQVAQKPNDAVNQKRLAVALERASAGRFTTQALDYIIKAGWGNTLQQWANNPSTGALPPDIMRQLVDGAHQNMQGAKDALNIAMGDTSAPTGGDDMISVQIPGQAPGKIHRSQKDAFLKKYPNAKVQ
jgi:hypothetical protein